MSYLEQLKERRDSIYSQYKMVMNLSANPYLDSSIKPTDITDMIKYFHAELNELTEQINQEEIRENYNLDMIDRFAKNYPEELLKMIEPHQIEQFLRKQKLEQLKKPSK